jgi:hypothetical protein
MKSKHQINKLSNQINNPPPTSGDGRCHLATRRPPPATDAATRRPRPATFPANKKKKKIDLATGGGRDPPQRPGGEIRPPSVAIFASGEPTKKKKNSGKPKKSFLMPQKSILMPQTRF